MDERRNVLETTPDEEGCDNHVPAVTLVDFYEKQRLEALNALARKRFDSQLSEKEEGTLLLAVSGDTNSLADEERAGIRPEFVRWLVEDRDVAPLIGPKGLWVHAARFEGILALSNCSPSFPIRFLYCDFEEEVNLAVGSFQTVMFYDCVLQNGFVGMLSSFKGFVGFERTSIKGLVDFKLSKIEGALYFNQTTIEGEPVSLRLDLAKVDGLVDFVRDFRCIGLVSMSRIQVTGDVLAVKPQFLGSPASLESTNAHFKGNMVLRESTFAGRLTLKNMAVDSDLDIALSRFEGEDEHSFCEIGGSIIKGDLIAIKVMALYIHVHDSVIEKEFYLIGATTGLLHCPGVVVKGDLHCRAMTMPEEGGIVLDLANVGTLRQDHTVYPKPGRLSLQRARFSRIILHPSLPADQVVEVRRGDEIPFNTEEMIAWLELQDNTDHLDIHPWLNCAAILRDRGDTRGAKAIMYVYKKHEADGEFLASGNRRLRRAFWARKRLLAVFEREPLLILVVIMALTLFGTSVFYPLRGYFAPTSEDAYQAANTPPQHGRQPPPYPKFSPVIYSLENALPLVKLGQDEKWAPDPNRSGVASYWFLMAVRWVLILTGWTQATILATVLGERFQNKR